MSALFALEHDLIGRGNEQFIGKTDGARRVFERRRRLPRRYALHRGRLLAPLALRAVRRSHITAPRKEGESTRVAVKNGRDDGIDTAVDDAVV